MNFLVFILNSILVTIYFEAYILPTNIGNKSPVLILHAKVWSHILQNTEKIPTRDDAC